jgi:methylglutaconyl-CoA hydratase
VISPYVIDAVGARHAQHWFQNAALFDAATALRMGLVHEVVAADALDAVCERQIQQLLSVGPIAVQEAKQLVWRMSGRSFARREQEDLENARLIARLRVSAEGQAGLQAFLGKTTPPWQS